MMERPRIHLEKSNADHLIEWLGHLFIFMLIVYTALHYSDLPDSIPTHYDYKGEPDGYGGKVTLWVIAGLGLAIYISIMKLNQFPHIFNYPTKITQENAKGHYLMATRMMRYINTGIAVLFFYINYSTIQIAVGSSDKLSKYFTPIIAVFIIASVVYPIIKTKKIDNQ